MGVATPLSACKVPVFRFALERWPADNYAVVAIFNEKPDQATSNALRELSESSANVTVESVDLQTLTEAELWGVEGLESTDQAPLLQVFFPERDGQRRLCWSGALTANNVRLWSDSPLRQQIASDIQSGVSAVWVFVEGPNADANAEMLNSVKESLAQASKQIAIPDGVIRREDAGKFLSANEGASMDDVLRSDIPLKIEFSIRTLAYGNQDELAMNAMVAGFTGSISGPFVFPIFGRGRMIEPLPPGQVEASSVLAACSYLVGECSCVIKALNPGVDLILNTDWQSVLGEQVVMVDATTATTPTEVAIPPGRKQPPVAKTAISPGSNATSSLNAWLLSAAILGVVTMIVVFVRRRPGW
jgi:hypothetical protein